MTGAYLSVGFMGRYYKTLRTRKMYKLHIPTVAMHLHWPKQTHKLTIKSVHYKYVMFYSTGPWPYTKTLD
jgi:hypothetical protein